MRRVVITGMGAVIPLGLDAETTWRGLVAGRSGVRRLATFDCTGFPVRIGGQVPDDFDPDSAIPPSTDRRWVGRPGLFGLAAVTEALADAHGAAVAYPPDERGVAMGASVGRPDLHHLLEIARVRRESGNPAAFVAQPPRRVMTDDQNVALNAMARMLGASGPMVGIHTACSGSGHAMGETLRLVQDGDARLMVVGGYDSLTTWADILGFALLGAMTDRYNDNPPAASRPFDNNRSGFVIGEGAVAFVVEELRSARARGAHIHAEILGYGSSLNAWRITDSPPDGAGAIEAMEAAIADSGLAADEIDVVVAHGTGTQGNDVSETRAIKKVFGDHAYRLAVTSPKSMTGHLTAAAAALNVLVGIGAMRESLVPPTINLETPDRALDLDYVPRRARPMPVSAVLINALAFGGSNTSLVLASYQEDSL
ncbi:beta-ketoacyl-[acyl-carrier-protein] synthase family protein [Nocardia transvalensis]|uniref:beta-ketoacyl-[acyl-carrier-protein] synthase family protein n=1 Tax=Nocardia transvalensis TaxID=37333 RepID=UPI00189355C7|nr:beta-ketoacyl-[acyl-carrier-protein] synthase family protein [Nocardia transvalensis]MBF6329921.1 beta-ketoacyl-[acyl-carrier-protein] synthase family protein [Nocardia transvalensis]